MFVLMCTYKDRLIYFWIFCMLILIRLSHADVSLFAGNYSYLMSIII